MGWFHYPSSLGSFGRARIERAVEDANRKGTFAYHGPPDRFVPGPYAASDAAAVQMAVDLFLVVVQMLQRQRDRRSPDVLQEAADDLLDQIIVFTQGKQPTQTLSLEVFERRVRQALATQSGKLTFSASVPPPVVPTNASRVPPKVQIGQSKGLFPQQAEWLAHQLQLAGNLTPHGLEVLGGPDGKTTKRLLQGIGSRRDDVFHKIVLGLNEANARARRKVVLTLRDIPRN